MKKKEYRNNFFLFFFGKAENYYLFCIFYGEIPRMIIK